QEPWVVPAGSSGTGGRFVSGTVHPGSTVSYCGRSSAMENHGAFEPTKRCIPGPPTSPSSPARLPTGRSTIAPIGEGATDPHVPQKRRMAFADDGYALTACSPLIHRKPEAAVHAKVANGAPWCLRHIEQWQCMRFWSGPSIS